MAMLHRVTYPTRMVPLIESILKSLLELKWIRTGTRTGDHFKKNHAVAYKCKKVTEIITEHEKEYSLDDVKYAIHTLETNGHIQKKFNAVDFLQEEINITWEGEVAYNAGHYAAKRLTAIMKVWNFINPLNWFKIGG